MKRLVAVSMAAAIMFAACDHHPEPKTFQGEVSWSLLSTTYRPEGSFPAANWWGARRSDLLTTTFGQAIAEFAISNASTGAVTVAIRCDGSGATSPPPPVARLVTTSAPENGECLPQSRDGWSLTANTESREVLADPTELVLEPGETVELGFQNNEGNLSRHLWGALHVRVVDRETSYVWIDAHVHAVGTPSDA